MAPQQRLRGLLMEIRFHLQYMNTSLLHNDTDIICLLDNADGTGHGRFSSQGPLPPPLRSINAAIGHGRAKGVGSGGPKNALLLGLTQV